MKPHLHLFILFMMMVLGLMNVNGQTKMTEGRIGQPINDSLMTTFFNKTLVEYFSDTVPKIDQIKYGCLLLQTDWDTTKLLKSVGVNHFKYFEIFNQVGNFLVKPIKKNKGRLIYHISFGYYARDTLDINIYYSIIEGFIKQLIDSGDIRDGKLGYIPTARFIYDNEKGIWIYHSFQESLNKRLSEIDKHLHPKQE
ncbi:MAG: hypothetical protein WCL14_00255 [Bacteroidota bacterium]